MNVKWGGVRWDGGGGDGVEWGKVGVEEGAQRHSITKRMSSKWGGLGGVGWVGVGWVGVGCRGVGGVGLGWLGLLWLNCFPF